MGGGGGGTPFKVRDKTVRKLLRLATAESSSCGEEKNTDVHKGKEKMWEVPFVEEFDLLVYRFRRDGKWSDGVQRALNNGMRSWSWDKHIHQARSVSLKTKCEKGGESRVERGNEWTCQLGLDTWTCTGPEKGGNPSDEASVPTKNATLKKNGRPSNRGR